MSLPLSVKNCWTRGWPLLLAALAIAGTASAKYINVQTMDVKPTRVDCDGYRTFGYVLTWNAVPRATKYGIRTANCHRIGTATCNAAGQCSAPVNACTPGPSWAEVQATVAPDILLEREGVRWPVDANGRNKVCK